MRFPDDFVEAVKRDFPNHARLNLLVRGGSKHAVGVLEFMVNDEYKPQKTQALLRKGVITEKDAKEQDKHYRNASELLERCVEIISKW